MERVQVDNSPSGPNPRVVETEVLGMGRGDPRGRKVNSSFKGRF